jgi:HAD superfamily hydrolase (TIGR01509 family)
MDQVAEELVAVVAAPESASAPREPDGITAVVFDMDGVLVDSEQLLMDVWTEIFVEFGATFTVSEWRLSVGSDGGFDPHAALASRATKPLPQDLELASIIAERETERLLALQVLPGVTRWIEDARALGLAVAVASSSPEEIVDERLAFVGLFDQFPVRVGRGPNRRAKPAPDVFLEACRRLGVAPRNALAVEDSPNGLLAARAAGMACVVVPNHVTVGGDFAGASLVAEGLDHVRLEVVLAALADITP